MVGYSGWCAPANPIMLPPGTALSERYADQEFSYADCLSFAVMRDMGLVHAFTGDYHFAILGFGLVPWSGCKL
jgi:hypothetical protein